MNKILMIILLVCSIGVCQADAGEANPRELLCAKIGGIAKKVRELKTEGQMLDTMLAEVEMRYKFSVFNGTVVEDGSTEFQEAVRKELIGLVMVTFESTEDTTPSAAYATQYTKCLTKETFAFFGE